MKTLQPGGLQDLNEVLWHDLLYAAQHDDGAAAKAHLQAGFPIYYVKDDTPEGLLIKEHPNGRRELVRFDEDGDEVIRVL